MSICRYLRYGNILWRQFIISNSKDARINSCIDSSKDKVLCIPKNFNNEDKKNSQKDNNFHSSQTFSNLDTLNFFGISLIVYLRFQNKFSSKEKYEDCSLSDIIYPSIKALPNELSYASFLKLFSHFYSNQLDLKSLALPKNAIEANKDTFLPHDSEALFNESSIELPQSTSGSIFASPLNSIEGNVRNKRGVEEARTNLEEAFQSFRIAARKGSKAAHFNLGICYQSGLGATLNIKKAIKHFTIASQAGHREATYNLGAHYYNEKSGKKKDLGYELIYTAAYLGVTKAQVDVGHHYYEAGDLEQAAIYFNKAAEKQNHLGQCYLGLCYLEGYGVEVDTQRGFELLTLAAEGNEPAAFLNLSLIYEKGRDGIPIDTVKAHDLLIKAANLGNEEAQEYIKKKELEKRNLNEPKLLHNSYSAPNLHILVGDNYKNLDISEYLNIFPKFFKKEMMKENFPKKVNITLVH